MKISVSILFSRSATRWALHTRDEFALKFNAIKIKMDVLAGNLFK